MKHNEDTQENICIKKLIEISNIVDLADLHLAGGGKINTHTYTGNLPI
jgi:hypothetical protein